jgi:transposase
MFDRNKRAAILELHKQGHAIRLIARLLQASRKTVRRVIRNATAEVPGIVRRRIAEQYRTQILQLYSRHHGNVQRVHEELLARGAHVSYPALTSFVRRNGIRKTIADMKQAQAPVPKSVVAAREWLVEITYGWRPANLFQTEATDLSELAPLLDLVRNAILCQRKKAATILARKAGWPIETIAKILHAPRRYIRRYLKIYSQSGIQGLFAPKKPRPSRLASDAEKANRILALLHCRPDSLGFNRISWTQDDLGRAYKTKHGETISSHKVRLTDLSMSVTHGQKHAEC